MGAHSRKMIASALLIFTIASTPALAQEPPMADAPQNVPPVNGQAAPESTPAYRANEGRDNEDNTYDEKSIIAVTSDFLGTGTAAVAKVVEKIFADLGRPNAYITGSEMSAAAIVGLRYGDGDLHHKIEGNRRVFWTGPSLGLDLGGNASRSVTLIYHLYDNEDLFQRFPAVEGSFYYIGGLGVNYQQKGNIILAPIRLGLGLRAGANLGYIHYTRERSWIPF